MNIAKVKEWLVSQKDLNRIITIEEFQTFFIDEEVNNKELLPDHIEIMLSIIENTGIEIKRKILVLKKLFNTIQ